MKIKYVWLITLVVLVSGCGKYTRTQQTYDSQKIDWNLNADICARSFFSATKNSHRVNIFSKADFSSAPYRFKFWLHSRKARQHPLLIHSVKITAGDLVILEERHSPPITIAIEKGCSTYYNALFSRELGNKLPFKEGLKLESQVEWEIPGTRGRQILTTRFTGIETKTQCPIWSSKNKVY